MWKRKKKEPKEKVFDFSVSDIRSVGDKYVYNVKGFTREEALQKLVEWFYGEGGHFKHDKDIEHTSFDVRQPINDSFTSHGMPYWFARAISGGVGSRSQRMSDRADLTRYMEKKGIKEDKR
jgi:hypothetical protein